MKLTVFSDTHDHFDNTIKAINIAKKEGAGDFLIHCGDICAPLTLSYIIENWDGEIHYCFGNVDGDRLSAFKIHQNNSKVFSYREPFGKIDIKGRSIAFQHYPEIAKHIADSGMYDAVFYGHDHFKYKEYINKTLLANPGNICGIKHDPSFAIYDTEDNTLVHFDL